MKAQAAIEFVTSYAWALLVIIVMAVSAYYFISVTQQTPPQCDIGVEFPCRSYQFFEKSDRTMKLVLQLTNGIGKDIFFYNKKQTITVQGAGKVGINNYSGTCVGPADVVKGGDTILCIFNITDKDVVPEAGKTLKFDILLNYTNCAADPLYPVSCSQGTNRTIFGHIASPLEILPSSVAARCMDGNCDSPQENYTNCYWDCSSQAPRPTTVVVKSTSDCGHPTPINVPIEINVTVKDQHGAYMAGVPVKIVPEETFSDSYVAAHMLYTLTPSSFSVTDSNGLARANLTWYGCTCCVSDCSMPLFTITAVADSVTGSDSSCSYLTSWVPLGCCP